MQVEKAILRIMNLWQKLLALRHRKRRRIIIAIDMVFVAITALLTHKITNSYDQVSAAQLTLSSIILIITSAITFNVLRVHRAIIRHLDVNTISKLFLAIIISVLLWIWLTVLQLGIPSSVSALIITGIMMMTFPLIGYRLFLFWLLGVNNAPPEKRKKVAIYGTDEKSRQVAASLDKSRNYRPAFFIGDDDSLAGGMLNGIRVYQSDQLDWALGRFNPEMFIFSCSEQEFNEHRALFYKLIERNITVRLNTSPEEQILAGSVALQSRAIDLPDLIGRTKRPVKKELLEASIGGKRVLVTGAGGSIGSVLSQTIAAHKPDFLAILDSDENRLVQISRKLRAQGHEPKILLGNVCDQGFIDNVLSRNRFDAVFHAAAYKHVDIGESVPISMIRNNVLGTDTLLKACNRHKVGKLVFISSDKAVEPANVMGGTKKWCEELIRSGASKRGGTKYSIVRFGNVIESSGSVVPLMKEQIAAGGPVTITDKAMKRYFMSIGEAVDLILQAASLAGNGDTYILKMGEPVPIINIAETLVHLSGNTVKSADNPRGEIEIIEIGKRKGEKLDEKLYGANELVEESDHPAILKSRTKALPMKEMQKFNERLLKLVENGTPADARHAIMELLEEMETFRNTRRSRVATRPAGAEPAQL